VTVSSLALVAIENQHFAPGTLTAIVCRSSNFSSRTNDTLTDYSHQLMGRVRGAAKAKNSL
jgi:hypothetical protein